MAQPGLPTDPNVRILGNRPRGPGVRRAAPHDAVPPVTNDLAEVEEIRSVDDVPDVDLEVPSVTPPLESGPHRRRRFKLRDRSPPFPTRFLRRFRHPFETFRDGQENR